MWLNIKIHNLFVNSFSFSTFIVMLFPNRDSLLLFQFFYLSFLIFIAITRTLNKIFNRIVESRHHCLLPILVVKPPVFQYWKFEVFISSVQLLSHVWLFAAPWTVACRASLSITNSRSLLKLRSIKSVMPSNHLSSAVLFFSCLHSFPASGSFPMSQFSFTISPFDEYSGRFPLGWTGWISLQSKGLSSVFSNTTVQKHQFCGAQLSL